MSNALNIIKIIGAWGFLAAAVIILFMGPAVPVQPLALAAISIAFSQAPIG